MEKVAIVKGRKSPNESDVIEMVRRAIDLVGGISSIVKPGDKVVLKPNIVTGKATVGVTTDPRVVKALILMVQEANAREILVAEGAGYGSPTPEAFERSGIKNVAERLGAKVVDVDTDDVVEVAVPGPLILDKILVSKAFWECDAKINVPIMKTHDQMIVTLGMKNMKGVVPKPEKRRFHRIGLAKAIVDLNRAVRTDLTVVDGIVAMEGLGPGLGDPVEMDVVLAGKDVAAVDTIGIMAMGFNPSEIQYLKLAKEVGFGITDRDKIEVVGEPLETTARKFKPPPMDLAPTKGVTVIEKAACSACRGTIRSVFFDLERLGTRDKIQDLTIAVGPLVELSERPKGRPLIMGTCLTKYRNFGRFVVGCPPNNDQMIEAIHELCSIDRPG
jgi:uncharacterized protein (DUF362 family)